MTTHPMTTQHIPSHPIPSQHITVTGVYRTYEHNILDRWDVTITAHSIHYGFIQFSTVQHDAAHTHTDTDTFTCINTYVYKQVKWRGDERREDKR